MLDGARIFHLNINCSNLAASRAFYVEGIGLVEGVRTTPDEVQPGTAFGLDRARWDAWILVGANGFDGGAIDLLEWHEPRPTGAPPTDVVEAGFQRVGVNVSDRDLAIANIGALDPTVLGEPTGPLLDGRPVRRELVRDPDGVAVELIEGPSTRLSFIAVTCSDVKRSVAFYRALGFHELDRTADREVPMEAPDRGEVQLRLTGFEVPTVRPGAPRPANALGMWRAALLLSDLDGAVSALRAAGIELISDPQSMSMGPGIPDLRFVCFRGPDHEVIELIESPHTD
jgi:Lactoylglutathione lyase and related lyases